MVVSFIKFGNTVITPIFTAEQAGSKEYFRGIDKQGPFVACLLGNHPSAAMFGWYIKVSPEDYELICRYNWCGNNNGRTIEVRRREKINGKDLSFHLANEIWERMGKAKISRVYRYGHILDFRRQNLFHTISRTGCRGVVWHKLRQRWQVQIVLNGDTTYIGTASYPNDGYRMYNRYLRSLKQKHPEDQKIQAMEYNEVFPMF
jgi:hypothetical protein